MSKKIEVVSFGTTNTTYIVLSTLTVTPIVVGGKGPMIHPPPIIPTSSQKALTHSSKDSVVK